MKKEKIYNEKNIYGAYWMCYDVALVITNIIYNIEDKIEVGFMCNGKIKTPRKHKIYTSNKGNYIKYKGTRFYLDEFIRY